MSVKVISGLHGPQHLVIEQPTQFSNCKGMQLTVDRMHDFVGDFSMYFDSSCEQCTILDPYISNCPTVKLAGKLNTIREGVLEATELRMSGYGNGWINGISVDVDGIPIRFYVDSSWDNPELWNLISGGLDGVQVLHSRNINWDSGAVYLPGRNVISRIFLKRLSIQDCHHHGIYADDLVCNWSATDCIIHRCGGAAVLVGGGRNWTIKNLEAEQCGYGILIDDRLSNPHFNNGAGYDTTETLRKWNNVPQVQHIAKEYFPTTAYRDIQDIEAKKVQFVEGRVGSNYFFKNNNDSNQSNFPGVTII